MNRYISILVATVSFFLSSILAWGEEKKAESDLQGPFFMVDESPVQVLKLLEELTGQTSLQSPDLPNVKINFQTTKKLTREEAIISIKSKLPSLAR